MYVKGPSTESGSQPQMAPAISSCPGYPSIKYKHCTSFSAPPQRLPCQAPATLGSLPPIYYVSLNKSLTFPNLSFPICKMGSLGLDELEDPLLPRHLYVPVSPSHSSNQYSFKPRLMPAGRKTGRNCGAVAHCQSLVLPQLVFHSRAMGCDDRRGRYRILR